MAIKSFKRYEKKYILTKDQYEKLVLEISKYMVPDKFCRDGKNYSIYNVYYDTKDNQVIRHSIDKPYYKEKLRLRSYFVPKSKEDKVFLELKKKINGIVSKRRVVMSLGEVEKFLKFREKPKTSDYVNNQVLKEIEYYLKNNKVEPKIYISYSRKAFFAIDDKDFRVTFDSKLLTRRDNLNLESGPFGTNLLDPNTYLMEVKILGAMPLWFTEVLSKLKIYNTHFSKYGNEYMDYTFNQKFNLPRRKNVC